MSAAQSQLHGRVLELAIHGRSLEGNLLGDSPDRTISIYLPPSYDRAPERRFPVIYLLGGYAAEPELAKMPGLGVKDLLFTPTDGAIVSGKLGEVILVNIEGWNRLGGSFWVNSPATGNWEDFVTRDVITLIDAKFRTIAERDSRGLYGGSMGGFGAISIAMHRPELFGTVFAQSPCCLAMVEELGPAPAWEALGKVTLEQADAAFQHGDPTPLEAQALAAAFAPDSNRAPFYGDLPYRVESGRVLPDEPAYSRWTAHLPAARLDREAAGLKTLHGFRIQYGDHDTLRHIVVSVPALDSALTAHGIPHETHVDHGGHVEFERFGNDALPFFARTLAGAAGDSAPGS
ncbi:MAG TPA: alpha/beta hydrolase-fold protein [Gemmatimonadaceae bacterium]|nr:alpha/beta hydrolase-fold protein [Gemmatimonadaceae bacterium]